jgi:hypothetical protein
LLQEIQCIFVGVLGEISPKHAVARIGQSAAWQSRGGQNLVILQGGCCMNELKISKRVMTSRTAMISITVMLSNIVKRSDVKRCDTWKKPILQTKIARVTVWEIFSAVNFATRDTT